MPRKQRRRIQQASRSSRLISVAMIARNEAGNLPRAVTSAQRFADEIIVVDTGSTDDSIRVASKLGCHVYPFEWVHDYAKARNFSFSKCKAPIIWWQDPDEEVPEEDAPKVRRLAEVCVAENIDEVMLPTFLNATYRPAERDLPGYGPGVVVMKPRLVRRGRLSWRWNVHEDLYRPGDLRRITDESVRVFNHGDAHQSGNEEYYLALMIIGLRDHPGEPHYLLYLAEQALVRAMDANKALSYLNQIDPDKLAGGEQMEKYWLFVGQAWKTLAIFAHSKGMATESQKAAATAARAYGQTTSMRGPLQAASMFLYFGQRDTFIEIVDNILEKEPGELMAQKFKELADAFDDPAELNEKVGGFLMAIRGGAADMEQAVEMAKAGQATVEGMAAEPWDEEKEDRQIVIVVGYRCPLDVPERRRNLTACVAALARQDVNPDIWRLSMVEQDSEHHLLPEPNPGWPGRQDLFDRSYEPFNRGRALNFGVSHAGVSGKDLVCLMDADMLVDPGWLRRCLTAMPKDCPAMLPYNQAIYMDEKTTEYAILAAPKPSSVFPHGMDITGDTWHSQGGCIWVTAELYEEMGGHDERYVGWGSADRDFYVRLSDLLASKSIPGVFRMSQPLYHMWHPKPDESQKADNAALFAEAHPDVSEEEVAKL